MTEDAIAAHTAWFLKYAQGYLTGDQGFDKNITLKKDHSLRVFDEARGIVSSLDLPGEIVCSALLAALYHDVGRFPQYAKYKTFKDSKSVRHAVLGVQVLKRENALADLEPDRRKLVLAAVALHGIRRLPGGLPGDLDLVARIVRDADKLDIFKVMLTHFVPQGPENSVVTLGLKNSRDNYTRKMLDGIFSETQADYRDMVWINDFKLMLASWTFDLNFSATRRAFLERGYIDRLFNTLPSKPEFADVKKLVVEKLEENSK